MSNIQPSKSSHWVFAALGVAALALGGVARAQDVLLVPDWTNKKVLEFSTVDGHLINSNFIVNNGAQLSQPGSAINSGHNSILVGDQITDAIQEYNLDGTFKRTLETGNGHVRGLDVYNDQLYAITDGGTKVKRFDLNTGALLGTFISGIGNGQDLLFRSSDILLSDRGTNSVFRYDLSGAQLSNFVAPFANNTNINYPYGITQESNGNVLVGGFALPSALFELDANGNQVATYGTGLNRFYRGGYRLDDGDIFTSAFNAISVFNHTTNAKTDILTSGNFQFVKRVSLTAIPEPGTLSLLALAAAPLLRRRRR